MEAPPAEPQALLRLRHRMEEPPSTIDINDHTGDKRGCVEREKDGGAGDFLRLSGVNNYFACHPLRPDCHPRVVEPIAYFVVLNWFRISTLMNGNSLR